MAYCAEAHSHSQQFWYQWKWCFFIALVNLVGYTYQKHGNLVWKSAANAVSANKSRYGGPGSPLDFRGSPVLHDNGNPLFMAGCCTIKRDSHVIYSCEDTNQHWTHGSEDLDSSGLCCTWLASNLCRCSIKALINLRLCRYTETWVRIKDALYTRLCYFTLSVSFFHQVLLSASYTQRSPGVKGHMHKPTSFELSKLLRFVSNSYISQTVITRFSQPLMIVWKPCTSNIFFCCNEWTIMTTDKSCKYTVNVLTSVK